MNEAEWLACDDPLLMLDSLRGKISDRKLRLFACACCRSVGWNEPNVEFLQTVETSERCANGSMNKAELKRARQSVRKVRHLIPAGQTERYTEWVALWLAEVTASENAFCQMAHEIQRLVAQGLIAADRQPPCRVLLQDLFGPRPFRPVTINPIWLTPNIVALAQTIYDNRAFERLPELADALANVGCDHEDIVRHLRSEGPHVRGCWVVDLVLGKE